MKIRLAADLQADSIVDGEGIRTVLWTQGCPHNCKGCHNPQTHDFNGGVEVDVEEVISKRSASIYKADGDMKFKSSEDNESVAKIYNEMLNNDEHLIHKLLHYIHTED